MFNNNNVLNAMKLNKLPRVFSYWPIKQTSTNVLQIRNWSWPDVCSLSKWQQFSAWN